MSDPVCCRVAREAARLTNQGRDWRADEIINYLDPECVDLVTSLNLDDNPEQEAEHVAELVAGVRKRRGKGRSRRSTPRSSRPRPWAAKTRY